MELIFIEDYLRRKMIATAEMKGALSDPEVIKVSQQLDKFLSQAQQAMTGQCVERLHATAR